MREHNLWVRDSEMGNAQEAIEDYENHNDSTRRLDTTKSVTPQESKRVTMVLNFRYKDGSCFYLAQREDGKQKWVKDPDPDVWHNVIQDYWYSVRSDSGKRRALTAVGTPALTRGVMLRFFLI